MFNVPVHAHSAGQRGEDQKRHEGQHLPPRVAVIDGRRTSQAIRTMLNRITAIRIVVFPVIGFSQTIGAGSGLVSMAISSRMTHEPAAGFDGC